MAELEMVHPDPARGFEHGQRVTVDDAEAKHMIRSGVAVPATASAANSLGEDPETAATSRRKQEKAEGS